MEFNFNSCWLSGLSFSFYKLRGSYLASEPESLPGLLRDLAERVNESRGLYFVRRRVRSEREACACEERESGVGCGLGRREAESIEPATTFPPADKAPKTGSGLIGLA